LCEYDLHVVGKKAANKDGFLTDHELNYWSENFKVDESEIRSLPPSSELLCLKKNLVITPVMKLPLKTSRCFAVVWSLKCYTFYIY